MSAVHGVETRRVGDNAEGAVIQRVRELELVPDSENEHYDAVAAELLEPSPTLPFVGIPLVAVGTEIEIKSTIVVYADDRRGRVLLRRRQHSELLERGGMYVFAVCEPRIERDVLALKLVPASLVDEEIPGWITVDGGSDYCQLAWSRFFSPAEVER